MTNPTPSTAWTDGASSGNPGPSGWAVLIDGKLIYGRMPNATNNEMEMFAIYQAVVTCPPNRELTIHTDSQISINWLTKNYKCNKASIEEIRNLINETLKLRGVTLRLVKTKGHATDNNNNLVDKSARAQTQIAKSELIYAESVTRLSRTAQSS